MGIQALYLEEGEGAEAAETRGDLAPPRVSCLRQESVMEPSSAPSSRLQINTYKVFYIPCSINSTTGNDK